MTNALIQDAIAQILASKLKAGVTPLDLSQWLLVELVLTERTLDVVLSMTCGKGPLCDAIREEAGNRARIELGL